MWMRSSLPLSSTSYLQDCSPKARPDFLCRTDGQYFPSCLRGRCRDRSPKKISLSLYKQKKDTSLRMRLWLSSPTDKIQKRQEVFLLNYVEMNYRILPSNSPGGFWNWKVTISLKLETPLPNSLFYRKLALAKQYLINSTAFVCIYNWLML